MLSDIKKHYNEPFKYIGSGTYSETFIFYYDKSKCPHLKINSGIECNKCKLYPQSDNYVIKEIQNTYKYTKCDFDNEVMSQTKAMKYMPNLIVNIYEYWEEIFKFDNNQNIVNKLGTKKNENNDSVIPAYYYIITEYMNYKDLYTNYKSCNSTSELKSINMIGLLCICLIILYNLHCKLEICHGDFRDTNIFLKYIGIDYKQKVSFEINNKNITLDVDTGGFHIKLGDFGLSENLRAETKTFIFRDYEFIENIYKNRETWKWMISNKDEYKCLISFIQINFINNINQCMNYYHYIPEQSKSRIDFWYAKHSVHKGSSYLYSYPKKILIAFIKTFYPDETID